MRFQIHTIVFCINLIFSCLIYSSETIDNHYGQFVDIENYNRPVTQPCHQDKAYQFLQQEYIQFYDMLNFTQSQKTSSCLVDATIKLYFATEVASYVHTIEEGVSSKKSSWQDCLDMYKAQCRLKKNKNIRKLTCLYNNISC